jgi:hypothetical protein
MVLLGAFRILPTEVVFDAPEALPPGEPAMRVETTLELTETGRCQGGNRHGAKSDEEMR